MRGPLLFIIDINDNYEGLANGILKLAGDTNLFGVVSNGNDVEKIGRISADSATSRRNGYLMLTNVRL